MERTYPALGPAREERRAGTEAGHADVVGPVRRAWRDEVRDGDDDAVCGNRRAHEVSAPGWQALLAAEAVERPVAKEKSGALEHHGKCGPLPRNAQRAGQAWQR